jgi:gamma-glutamyltranspeptidase
VLSARYLSDNYLTGIAALLALGILENIQELGKVKPLLEMEHNSVEYLHTLVEAMRYVVTLWRLF